MTLGFLECDVAVIGAGPAGAAAAQLLASWGRSVILVHRAGAPRHCFAAGGNLPALARLARHGGEVPALIEAYRAQVGPAPLGGLLTGLSLLVARQALVAEDSLS